MAKTVRVTKVPVSYRALRARIRRKLQPDYIALVKSRSYGERSNLGEYYTLDTYQNSPKIINIDLESFARELGVLAPWESVGG